MGLFSFLKYTIIIFAAHLATSCGAPFENHCRNPSLYRLSSPDVLEVEYKYGWPRIWRHQVNVWLACERGIKLKSSSILIETWAWSLHFIWQCVCQYAGGCPERMPAVCFAIPASNVSTSSIKHVPPQMLHLFSCLHDKCYRSRALR
jgi:hypothetical protein